MKKLLIISLIILLSPLSALALSFDNVDDDVTRTIADFRSGDSLGTVSAWIKGSGRVFSSTDTDGPNKYIIFSTSAPSNIRIEKSGGDNAYHNTVTTNNSYNSSRWVHVVWQSNGTSWSMYVNGVLQSLSSPNGDNDGDWFADISNRDNFFIGAYRKSDTSGFFSGLIAEVRVYNRVLMPGEIRMLYRGFASRNGLVGYWPLIGNASGTFEPDFSGYGNHGTRTNGPVRAPLSPFTRFRLGR